MFFFKKRKRKRLKNFIQINSVSRELLRLALLLSLLIVLHTLAMVFFEKMDFNNALWLSVTTATTVGYGDFSAQTAGGRISTIVLLYVLGISILAQVGGLYFEFRQDTRQKKLHGNWRWEMKNHIVFLNSPLSGADEYFFQIISQLRRSKGEFGTLPVVIVDDCFPNGLSERLRDLGAVLVNKSPIEALAFEDSSLIDARLVVLLSADEVDKASDSVNFDLIDRIRGLGFDNRIIAEAVSDLNRARLLRVGANNVLRPIRSYPELLSRTILAPGSEQVIETLFDSHGDECIRYELSLEKKWSELVSDFVSKDLGIPIAYEDKKDRIINNPLGSETVNTDAVFVIVKENHIRPLSEIKSLVSA